ncbi:CLUMA_CG001287, isoform A [Clunio marinus]|uniref:CLUMA_CG001287, isoform A n=1 Tax=Clunio marinus TaxID=568069 RepID=A0A1J1HM13_9DIPT|nr:CLUMA_CG001287, isoform A [Clunio marinus]
MLQQTFSFGDGFAYVGGACVVNKRLEKVNSVAIIEDTGGFSGIIVAAHEVGHLLGAVHDGSPPPSYLGGPGAEKCRWEDGYIMSDLRHTERGFRWSPCSVQSFHHFLNGDTASCLHNAPHEDEALGRQLPGTLLSLDAQCRRDRGTSACFKDERVCAQLFCFDAASGYCVAYRPAAEGSSCGDGQHCLDGKCVQENENIIPDYSQHTPSYISPNSFNSQFQNDLRKVLNEAEVTLGELETTKKSTTTTTTTTTQAPSTTKSTTTVSTTKSTSLQTQRSTKRYYAPSKKPDDVPKTPKTYFSNSFYHNNNQNNINNGQTDRSKNLLKKALDIETPTPAPTKSTISPYYYGFNRLPQYTTSTQKSSRKSWLTTTTQKPYIFQYYTTTKKVDLLASTKHSTNFEVDNNNFENQGPSNDDLEVAKSKTSTYNPVFDIYFKQIGRQRTTTRKPYVSS